MVPKPTLALAGVALLAALLVVQAANAASASKPQVYSSDRLEDLKSCVSAGEGGKLMDIFETCKAEYGQHLRIRMCMIKKTLRSDTREAPKLFLCLFKS